jgi:hypothetical protein
MARATRTSANQYAASENENAPDETIVEELVVPQPNLEEEAAHWEIPGEFENLVSLDDWARDCKTISPELLGGFVHNARLANMRYDTPSGWKAKAISWSRKPV